METNARWLSLAALSLALSACTITMDQNTVSAVGTVTALCLSGITLVLVPMMTARNLRATEDRQLARAIEERRLADLDRAIAARERIETKEEVARTAAKMDEVSKSVDGKMKEMVEIASSLAGAKATAAEKEKQEGLTAARAEGALGEVARRGVDDANSAAAVAAVMPPAAEQKLAEIKEKTDELTFSQPGEVDAGKKGAKGEPGPAGPPGPSAPGAPIPPGSITP